MTFEVVADRDRALDFIRQHMGMAVTDKFKGLCQVKDGEVVAAVLYDEFNGSNIMMHVAATPDKRWMTKHFLHEAFKFPFVTLGCRRITGPVYSDNKEAEAFNLHLGFRREAVLHKAGPAGQDVFLHVMFREDCRYA